MKSKTTLSLLTGIAAALSFCGAAQAQAANGAAAATAMPPAVVTVERTFNKPCYNAIPVMVFVDGKPVGAMAGGQMLQLHVVPGRYQIAIAMGGGSNASGSRSAITVDASTTHAATLLANLDSGGSTLRAVRR